MSELTSCNNATLKVYQPTTDNPWDAKKVQHLCRRLGFGATHSTIESALLQTPSDFVDALIDEAINMPETPAPVWGLYEDYSVFLEVYGNSTAVSQAVNPLRKELECAFCEDMRTNNLRDRLTLFWSNHFVTEFNTYNAPNYLFQQYQMWQTQAIGNFKDFVREVGLNKAMLFYLNGFENKASSPNENYARELYELFTMGVDNGYTQDDIVETARALTGYNQKVSHWGEIAFNPTHFDAGNKTIFGQTGNWDYDDVIDILFAQKETLIATYICKKFYAYFVSPELNMTIVDELAQTFISSDFEIAPVLRLLFKSEHFFDAYSIGTIVKSPMDLFISFQKELEMEYVDRNLNETTRTILYYLNVTLFIPPNVAGWSEDNSWLTSATLPERWLRMKHLLIYQNNENNNILKNFAINLFDVNEDADVIAKGVVDHFLSKPLVHDPEYDEAIAIFKSGVPENYFTDGTWSLNYSLVPTQVFNLLKHIIIIPEFQLK